MKVEDIENGASSSPFTKSASDVDGKGKNYKRSGTGLSNQKKAVMKGSTSPNISASYKAIRQSERSEKSESVNNKTQMETGSGQDPNSCSGAHSRPQSGSLSREDLGLNDGLSTEQYDPLTNYLSPRPKFLRYKPNRSREIFLRQQNEVGEDIYSGAALNYEQKALLSPGSSSEEVSENEEEEGSEEEGEEIEEDDEEFEADKGWTFKKVFKFIALLMAAVLYATTLISSSNTDPMSAHSFRSNEVLANGTSGGQDCNNEAVFVLESDFLDPMYGRRKGWREEEVKMIIYKFENDNDIFQVEEVDGGFCNQSAEVAELKDADREVGGLEGGGKDGDDDLAEVKEQEFQELFENVIETNEDQNPFSSEIASAKEMAITKTDSSEKDGEDDLAEGEEQEFEDHIHCKGPTETEIFEIIETPFSSEIAATDRSEEMAGSDPNFFFSSLQNMNTQQFFKILASFSAFLIVVIVSVAFYRSKKKIAIEKQQFQRVEALELKNETTLAKACSESVIVEENDSIISQEGRAMASIWLKEEDDISIKRYYSSRAPTVELLGEFVVGGEAKNTLKNKMVESSKDSNNLVSFEERSGYSRPALSELSNSPSHGSFTAEKIMKNKATGGGDSKVISTPVRRSSRIKNRAAMSP